MFDGTALAQLTSGATAGWAAFFVFLIWVVRTWPHWKAKVNEARKIEIEGEATIRGQLLKRVGDLEEAQHRDRLDFITAMSDERKRCDGELDEIRAELKAERDERKGLESMIRQNSQSTAQMMGDPGGVAITGAARKRRGDDQK